MPTIKAVAMGERIAINQLNFELRILNFESSVLI